MSALSSLQILAVAYSPLVRNFLPNLSPRKGGRVCCVCLQEHKVPTAPRSPMPSLITTPTSVVAADERVQLVVPGGQEEINSPLGY